MTASSPSDYVSLSDILAELERVQAEKAGLLQSLQRVEAEELRLSNIAHALKDFLEYRRAKGPAEPDFVVREPGGGVVIGQVKTHDGGGDAAGRDGKSIVGWAAAALREQGTREPLDTWPLIHGMQALGFTSSAEKIYLSVYGTLNRAAKRPESPVVKVGSQWGLREWYPDGVPAVPVPAGVSLIPTGEEEEQEEEQAMLIPDNAS